MSGSRPKDGDAHRSREAAHGGRLTYEATLEWLYALEAAKGMDFKLERVALALARLGRPERRFPSIHIAGTNGKGSVAAMIHAVLDDAGYRVGLYTSPHLQRLTERIRVGDEEISPDEVVSLTGEIQNVASGQGIGLTFFEFLTVMALVHFARRSVDVAVVEVGLGGRLDATNVLDPLVAVITTIGLDHTEWLGDSIEAIAAEKGGIIKPGRPVVLGDVEARARAVLQRLAAERGAPLIDATASWRASRGSLHFCAAGWDLPDIQVGLAGQHQLVNAGTAVAALAAVAEHLPVGEGAVRRGLASVRWPGRLEVVAASPLTVLDGAHNPQGVATLTAAMRDLAPGRKLHVLFAVVRDKPWPMMVDLLGPLCHSATVTEVLGARAQPCAPVGEAFRRHCPTRCDPEAERAWATLRERVPPGDAILVTGSLFLVGALYDLSAAPLAPPLARGLQP